MPPIRDHRFTMPVSDDGPGPGAPVLQRLLREWREACPPDGIPGESFIDPFRLRYILNALIVVDMLPLPDGRLRYRYRLIGTGLVARSGRDRTWRWVDEHPDMELARLAIDVSNAVIDARQPALMQFSRSLLGRYYPVEALVLPLGGNGGRPTRLLVGQIYPEDAPRRPYGDDER